MGSRVPPVVGLKVSRSVCDDEGEKELVARGNMGSQCLVWGGESGCGLLKLGFLENIETKGDLGVKLT